MHQANPAGRPERFNCCTEVELFSTRNRHSRHQSVGYKLLARAVDAIRFAIGDLPPQLLIGTYLEIDEFRYEGTDIRRLYGSAAPLARAADGTLR
jgi:hypothetical protein